MLFVFEVVFSNGIISLAPNITKILVDLELSDSITATIAEDIFPTTLKVGNFSKVNIEKIIKLKPDYVFYTAISQEKDGENLKKFKVPSKKIYISSIQELKESYILLGKMLDREKRASEIVKNIDKILKDIPKFNGKKVLGLIWTNPYYTFGERTFQGECLKILGLKNIASNLKDRYGIIKKEDIIRRNPDIIFIFIENGDLIKKDIIIDRAFNNISAIRSGRVYVIKNYDNFLQPSLRSMIFLRDVLIKYIKK